MSVTNSKTVVIVGAGLSGLCMAITLKELGIDFVILEKTDEVSGTWSQNRYPGCGCDIPMFAYCYSFEMFKGEAWPKQPAILEYFNHCVEKYGLKEHILFNAEVAQASFDKSSGGWQVSLTDERIFSSRFVINATGQLNTPNIPKLKGMEDFTGPVVHSAQYPHNLDLAGKRVGIVGNGATALQLVEAIQPQAAELKLFARSPKYIYPRVKYSPVTVNRMQADPEFWQQVRQQFINAQDQYRLLMDDYPQFDPFDKDSSVREFYAQANTDFAEFEQFYQWLGDQEFKPEFPTGCNRPLASNTFHDAVMAENVELVRGAVEGFNADAVQVAGEAYPVDVVILATGFALNNLIPPYKVTGSSGQALSDAWQERPHTYLGMATADYPNMFFLYGPNTNTNSTSVTFFVESQVNYIKQVMQEYLRQPFASIEVKADVLENYSRWLADKNSQASEAADCSGYYHNSKHINISTFPGSYREYEALTAEFKSAEYQLDYSQAGNAPKIPEHTLLGQAKIEEQAVTFYKSWSRLPESFLFRQDDFACFSLGLVLELMVSAAQAIVPGLKAGSGTALEFNPFELSGSENLELQVRCSREGDKSRVELDYLTGNGLRRIAQAEVNLVAVISEAQQQLITEGEQWLEQEDASGGYQLPVQSINAIFPVLLSGATSVVEVAQFTLHRQAEFSPVVKVVLAEEGISMFTENNLALISILNKQIG